MKRMWKTVGHIFYYAMLTVLVSFALSLVYQPLPEPFGLIFQWLSMAILGWNLPFGPEKTA